MFKFAKVQIQVYILFYTIASCCVDSFNEVHCQSFLVDVKLSHRRLAEGLLTFQVVATLLCIQKGYEILCRPWLILALRLRAHLHGMLYSSLWICLIASEHQGDVESQRHVHVWIRRQKQMFQTGISSLGIEHKERKKERKKKQICQPLPDSKVGSMYWRNVQMTCKSSKLDKSVTPPGNHGFSHNKNSFPRDIFWKRASRFCRIEHGP